MPNRRALYLVHPKHSKEQPVRNAVLRRSVAAIIVIGMALAAVPVSAQVEPNSIERPNPRLVTVTGDADVKVTPE